MKPIAEAIQELKTMLTSIKLFESIMDSLVVTMLILFAFALTSISWYWALVPAVIYGSIHINRHLKRVSYHDVEHKVPMLHEALRTAADTIETENVIVNELHQEVLQKMREIKTSVFLGFGRTSRQLVMLIVLSFLIILSSFYGVKLFDFPGFAFDLASLRPLQKYATEAQDFVFGTNDSALYGNESVAELGTKELQLKLNPLASEINIDEFKDPENKDFVEHYPSGDVGASQDASYSETIAKQHQKIVKNYFTGIARN